MSPSKRLKRLRRRELTDSSTRLANSSRTCVSRSATCSGQRVLVRLEDEANFRAFQGSGRKVGALRGDGEVEAFAVGQDAIACVEPERVRRAWLDGEGEVEHVAHGPQRIFDLDVERNHAVGVGLEIERGQIDGDAVEAGIDVLPAVRVAVTVVNGLRAEIGGNDDVHDGQAALHVFAVRAGSAGGHGHHGHALIGRKAAGNVVDERSG